MRVTEGAGGGKEGEGDPTVKEHGASEWTHREWMSDFRGSHDWIFTEGCKINNGRC